MAVLKTELFRNENLPLHERVQHLLNELTLEEKISLMCQYQDGIPRLGISPYKHGTEGAHGVAWLGKATVFPQNIGLACTWNVQLMKKIGEAIGDEARVFYNEDPEKNGLTIWAPTVDMERDPRWGRTEEAYGEDPHLTASLATALVKGMQGDHPRYLKTAATLKHFLGNNNEENRGECSVSIDPRNMREYYLKAFEKPFKEGKAQSVMTAYNAVNGMLCNINPAVNEIIKGEWKMDGFVVSDAGDVLGTVNEHHYVDSYAEAVALSVKNGIDSITDDKEITIRALRDALAKKWLTEKDLDSALANTFRVRFRLGEFDSPEQNPYASIQTEARDSKKHRALALQAARESIVLLKNNGLLPLEKKRVAVLGPLADEVLTDWYSGTPPYTISPLEGIKQSAEEAFYSDGQNRVTLTNKNSGQPVSVDPKTGFLYEGGTGDSFIYTDWGAGSLTFRHERTGKFVTVNEEGGLQATAEEAKGWFVKEVFYLNEGSLTTWDHQHAGVDENGMLSIQQKQKSEFNIEIVANGIEQAVGLAKEADAAVVIVGNNPFINGKECVDRVDLNLPQEQERLIKEVLKANPNTVVLVIGSYPFAINQVDEYAPAVLFSSHAGQELGRAVSDVLFGDYNPAGRLNMTWYKSVEDLPDLMDYDIIKGKRTYQYFDGEALYPFGHGLSYTSFDYKDLIVSKESLLPHESVEVTVQVENSGSRDGEEVVQLYVRSQQSRVKRPLKTLAGFKRIELKQGETASVTFWVRAADLAIWDVTREKYCVEAGTYTISAGNSSQQLPLETSFEVQGESIPVRTVEESVKAYNYDDYKGVYLHEGEEGDSCIRSLAENSWISFHDVQLKEGMISVRAANGGEETVIEWRAHSAEGPLLSTCTVPKTGGYRAFTTITAPILSVSENSLQLYAVFKEKVAIQSFFVSI